MEFTVPAHVQQITSKVRRFLDEEVIPLEAHAFDDPHTGLPLEMLHTVRQKAKQWGIWCSDHAHRTRWHGA